MHERIATQLNEILEATKEIPSWMTYGRTSLCQKDPAKGNSLENFRLITCLQFMWKLFTGIISEDMYCFMKNENLLPEEQKGCRRKSRGTKDQLLIGKAILKDFRKRRTNLSMAWTDYRKAYDFASHSWILECLDMFGIDDNVRSFLEESIKKGKLLLTSNGLDLCEGDVSRDIFQGDSLSPLIFVICMIPLSLLLRKVKASYEWSIKEFKMINLLFMDDLKLFEKNDHQIDSLVQTVFTFSEDTGMKFGLKKCGVVILKKRKLVRFGGIHLPNQEYMGSLFVKCLEKKMKTCLGNGWCKEQEQALRTNYTKNKIDKASENPLCRMCSERGETVQHIKCECKKTSVA